MGSNNIRVSHLSCPPSEASGFLNWSVWFLFFKYYLPRFSDITLILQDFHVLQFLSLCLFLFKLNSSPSLSRRKQYECFSMLVQHDIQPRSNGYRQPQLQNPK